MALITRLHVVTVEQRPVWHMDAEWHPLPPGAWLVTGTPYESGGPLSFATPYFLAAFSVAALACAGVAPTAALFFAAGAILLSPTLWLEARE